MTCDEARELLLEADLSELRGEGDSPLALHVTSCTACRAAANHLLAQTAALHAAVQQEPAERRRSTWRRAVPVGLAAAAAVAVLLVPRDQPRNPPLAVARPEQPRSGVNVVARNAAVLQTRNPKITVVWYF